MNKREIADILEEIGQLLELKGENPFKVRAYASGARALEGLEEDLGTLIEEGRLTKVSGIGKELATKIETLFRDGELPFYDELKASVPAGLVEMFDISGLGPKKIKRFHEELGIETVDELEKAATDGRIAALSGMGEKSAAKLAQAIANRRAYSRRHLWWKADEAARPILDGLRGLKGVERAEVGGSLRRGLETVGDLDFIVAAEEPGPVMEWFTSRPEVAEVTGKGETKSSVRLEGGLQADLRVVAPKTFPFTLHHFTGSKDHNVKMRQRALSRGWSLSEWGLHPGDENDTEREAIEEIGSEEALFEKLGLFYIPPALREDRGEIEYAEEHEAPRLVEESDLRGAFHNHTNASDGSATLEEMHAAAAELGWEYLGIADHSKASFQANGLDAKCVEEQRKRIEKFNTEKKKGPRLFTGVECDILPDGSLDLDDETLAKLDYVVVSVHSSFSQDEDTITRRIIRALEHPLATMLGHATGRLLLRREPYQVNLPKVIDAALANGKIIELNANPNRLDLDWRYWRRAAERGLLCAINPDAHRPEHLAFVRAGVTVARKGWLQPENVLNTWPLEKVEVHLKKMRGQ